MTHLDLTHGWALDDDDVDVMLSGPGGLEITLPRFDVGRLAYAEGLPPARPGPLPQFSWSDPLEGGGKLQYICTWDTEVHGYPVQHALSVGSYVLWNLPEDVGTRLQAWFVQVAEGRRSRRLTSRKRS